MATKIVTSEVLKIITEVYEVVFEANKEEKNREEQVQFIGKNQKAVMENEEGNAHKGNEKVENSSNVDQSVKKILLPVEVDNNYKSVDLEMVEIVDIDATKKGYLLQRN